MMVFLGYPKVMTLFHLSTSGMDASPSLNCCSASQELTCQGFGENMKYQTLRLTILAILSTLRYSCLEQKLN